MIIEFITQNVFKYHLILCSAGGNVSFGRDFVSGVFKIYNKKLVEWIISIPNDACSGVRNAKWLLLQQI